MNTITLIRSLRDAVLNDREINAWCDDYYGRKIKVLIGLDERNPPGQDDYPLVHLFPNTKTTGLAVEAKQYALGVTVGLYDESPAEDGEMPQLALLEELKDKVQQKILAALPSMICQRIDCTYETEGIYPYFLVISEFALEQPTEFREDPYD